MSHWGHDTPLPLPMTPEDGERSVGRVTPFLSSIPPYPPLETPSSWRVEKLNKIAGAEDLCTVSGRNVLNIGLTPHRSFKIYTGWISST